ncbi:MAG: PEP-CTERM sorting domain-containing protein [Pirellulales bacterium]
MTYTYDLSQSDPFTGFFTAPHPEAAADDTDDATDSTAVTSRGLLTDGDFGSDVIGDPNLGCCRFNNTTYAGFRNDGIGGAPQPKIDVDLGGTFNLNSFTLHYLVEDRPSIYSPQQISNSQGMEFNALTVSGSTDGENFSEFGFTNDFVPVFGPGGDVGTDVSEVRIATIDLTGSTASHVSIDIRTPWSWIFLSEIVVDGTRVGGLSGDYNGDGSVDAADYVVWRDTNINGQQGYDDWRANFGSSLGSGIGSATTAVPEPASIFLFGLGSLLLTVRKCS